MNNIPELLNSRKGKDYALFLLIALLGVFSFGFGRLSVSSNNTLTYPVTICEEVQPLVPALAANVSQSVNISQQEIISTGQYVGSKNGSVYHLPWCSGAKRIKEENKVWFATKDEAKSAGYRAAANCKGI